MYSFLVLGIVPGTNIQINFQDWMTVVGSIIVVILLAKLVALQFAKRETTNTAFTVRSAPHASQLHNRLSLV